MVRARTTHRTRRSLVVGSACVVVVAGVLAGRALADTGSGDASFRTAVVKRAAVSQTLQRSGTIEPVAQGTVAFPISGTVATVAATAGQTVTTGQALATLDPAALEATLTSKQATLAASQLTLSNALNGISSTGGAGGAATNAARTTTTTGARSSTAATSSGGASKATSPDLTAARQGVASGQQRVDAALGASRAALQTASSACAAQHSDTSSTSTSSSSSTSTSTSESTTTTTAPANAGPSNDCLTNLQSSLAAQQQVASAQTALAQAESKLDDLLSKASSPASTSGGGSNGGSGAAPATSTPSTSAGPSSAELVADQAAVDAAQADVTAAEQSLAQATIVSPLDGTVAAVNLRPGDQVTAASSTANIVVVGPGGYEAATTVLVNDIGKVKLGDDAIVVPDGSSTPFEGKVISIGVVPATSGTSTIYPVIVGLTGSPSGLHNGAATAVTITVGQAADALTVPTSAVRSVGGGAIHVVTVLDGTKTSTVPVQVGAVGADLTEIRSGLNEGQTVIVADLTQALPTSTNTNTRTGFGGGGLGGGGTFVGGGGIGRGG